MTIAVEWWWLPVGLVIAPFVLFRAMDDFQGGLLAIGCWIAAISVTVGRFL